MKNASKFLLAGLILLLTLSACSVPDTTPAVPTSTETLAATPTTTPTPTPLPTPTLAPHELVDEGDHALLARDYDTALRIFQASLNQTSDPNLAAKSHLGLGHTFYYKEDYALGLDHLREASATGDPAVAARANYLLGKTLTKLQRYQEALAAYEAYIELRPGLLDSHVNELRGDLFNTLDDIEQALLNWEEAYRVHPHGGKEDLAVKIARAYQQMGDIETALALYKDIYHNSSSDYIKAQMDILVGRIYLDQGDPESAIPYFQDAVTNFPHTGDAQTALVTLDNQAVEVNQYQRGLVNYYAENYPMAIEAFQGYLAQGAEEFADAALYHQALATRAAQNNGDPAGSEDAIALWQTLIRDFPTSNYYIDAWEDIEYTLWAYLNEPEQAAETALSFVAQRPEAQEAPDFLFLAGRSFERAGMLQEAADTWTRIADEYPVSERTFWGVYFAGIAYVRLGEWNKAQPLFARALVLTNEPDEIAAAHLWIGKCQEAKGDIEAALDSWKQSQIADAFGHYSIRAEDLLVRREVFAEPESYDLDPDLTPYRRDAEVWLRTTFDLPADTNLESPGLLANDPRLQRGMEYWSLGNYEAGKAEFESMRQEYETDPAQTFRLIPSLVDIGLYRSALIATTNLLSSAGLEGADALDAPEFFSRIRFGAYYLNWVIPAAESEDLSPLMMLSVMRQESAYEGFISSKAGALGLMQIMPPTGAEIANNRGWPEDYSEDDLTRPYVNLIFGAHYLRQQRQYFGGDPFAMLAAYNGGPGNTIAWKELAGSDDPDLLLEVIRIEETRNYIRLINEIYTVYRWLYGSPMTLSYRTGK